MKQVSYVRCPRCELNYMEKGEKVCSVCQKEMKAKSDSYDDLDLELDVCPICKVNYIQPNQSMCASCMAERENEDDDFDIKDNWDKYVDEEEEEMATQEDEVGEMASVGDIDEVFMDEDSEIPSFDDEKDDLDFSEDDDFEDDEEDEDDDEYTDDDDDFDDEEDFEPKKRKSKKSKDDDDDDFDDNEE